MKIRDLPQFPAKVCPAYSSRKKRTPTTLARFTKAVLERDRLCRVCIMIHKATGGLYGSLQPGRSVEADHLLMRSLGGTDDPENGLGMCLDCHRWKHEINTKLAREIGLMPSQFKSQKEIAP